MNEPFLEYFKDQLKTQDEWTVNELAEFFGVSHTTIRKRIEDGTITASKREIEGGYKWTIKSDEIRRNLSQSDTLQKYAEKKATNQGKRGKSTGTSTAESKKGGAKNDGQTFGDSLGGYLLEELRNSQDKVEKLQAENGRLHERVETLERENKELRAELDRLTADEEPKPLESGGAVDFAFETAHGTIDVVESMARSILPGQRQKTE